MQIFARLTKVDEASRTVSGVIANEAADRSGEVFDYASSKPLFEKWSQSFAKATGGKSVGNVRAMHGATAAGKLSTLNMDDASKSITVDAKIVDDNEWQKVQQGVYTGFSIGGKYAKKWADGDLTRYTAEPFEVSLVDLPCNPEAQFTVIKADNSQEMRKFVSTTDDEALFQWADANADALEKIARRKNVDPSEGKDKYGNDADFADPTNKKYPLNDAKHIRAAWSYIHMPKNADKYSAADRKTIESRIVAAWKNKIDQNGPPSAEKFMSVAEGLAKRADAQALAKVANELIYERPMQKGLYAVSQFACLLEQLACMADGQDNEDAAEGDDSKMGATLRAALKPLAAAFVQMANEETNEALHGQLNDDAAVGATPLARFAMDTDLEKRGRKHSAATRAHFDAIREHTKGINEHLDAMGVDDADGADDVADDGAQKLAKSADDLQKVTAERDELLKGMQSIKAELERLKAEPAPAKGVARVVEKSLDGQQSGAPDDKPVMKADGSVDHIATAMKLAKLSYSNPRVFK